ncbi:MAG: hypothetical protein KME06_07165 [Kastovskya adunca ATA6-11-RM4]|nr:hypothetical protein [Kastovskya adunca ATA6-11-RM4]
MRYSIMLQLVISIALLLLGAAALFAWLQSRTAEPQSNLEDTNQSLLHLFNPRTDKGLLRTHPPK